MTRKAWWIAAGVGALSATLHVVGCAVELPPSEVGSSIDSVEPACVDEDRDGFGDGCAMGMDCDDENPQVTDRCYRCSASPTEGCPCPTDGARVACGKVTSKVGSQVSCLFGQIECRKGEWGTCVGTNAPSLRPQALGSSLSRCPFNVCDPYCQTYLDTPDESLSTDGGIVGTDAGLAPFGSPGGSSWDAAPNGPMNSIVRGYLEDAGAMPSTSYYYHESNPGDPPSTADTLQVNAELNYLDVYFLLDTSATMGEALTTLGNAVAGTGGIIPSVRASFPNARFGVGHFHAYQIDLRDTSDGPFQAIPWIGSGNRAVFPFFHSLDIQSDDTAAKNVMLWLGAGGTTGNNDKSEGAFVALYTAATQSGLWAESSNGTRYGTSYSGLWHNNLTGGGSRYWVTPRSGVGTDAWVTDYPGTAGGRPALPTGTTISGPCATGTSAYPCFGSRSTPITIVMTDNMGTQGPGGTFAIEHNSNDGTFAAQYGLPGAASWPDATSVTGNGVEAGAVTINPGVFQRYRGNFSTNGAPGTGTMLTGSEGGFDLTNLTQFPTIVPGDTKMTDCGGTEGAGREAFFRFTVPSGDAQWVHFDTIGSQADTVLYLIDRATRKRIACNNNFYDYSGQPGSPATIEARLAPGDYTLVVDERSLGTCPSNYSAASNGRCYRRQSTAATWTDAQAKCALDGAQLVSFTTPSFATEESVVSSLLTLTSTQHYIGLRKSGSGWLWSDGTPMTTTNWFTGFPVATSGFDCVWRRTDGRWENVPCTTTTRPYVCEQGPLTSANYFLQVNAMPDTAPVALPTFDQMIAAHNAIGGKIIGIDVSGIGPINSTGTGFDLCDTLGQDPRSSAGGQAWVDRFLFASLQEAARRTGSIDGTVSNYWTNPFVFAMNSGGGPCHVGDPSIGTQVVSALTSLTRTARQDLSVKALDADDGTDFDYEGPAGATPQLTPFNLDEGPSAAIGRPLGVFIDTVTVVPITTGNGSHAPGPGGQLRCLDDPTTPSVIEQCLPDTRVQFRVTFSTPSAILRQSKPQIFKFDVNVVGSGQGVLGTVPAVIVVPPEDLPAYTTQSFTRVYDTTQACQPATQRMYGHWSWTATTPLDSRINFYIKAAATVAGLATATEYPLLFTNPPGPAALVGTSVRVDTASGTTIGAAVVDTSLARHGLPRDSNVVQLRSELVPSTGNAVGPTLERWGLEFDCVPNE